MVKRMFLLMLLCTVSSLNVAIAAPEAPVLTYGTTGLNAAATWTEVEGATGYTLFYAPSPYTGPESIQSRDMETETSISVDLPIGAAYYIAVKAYDDEGYSDYSNIGHFVIDPETAVDNPVPPQPALTLDSARRLAEAAPDECYVAAELIEGSEPPSYTHPGGVPPQTPLFDGENATCQEGALPKTNEAYVWGLTTASDKLWFGTGANVSCLVEGGYFGYTEPSERNDGTDSLSQVCEFGGSWIFEAGAPLPDVMGDWRIPSINYYDLNTGQAHYHVEAGGLADDPVGKARLEQTLGLRSAGSIGDIVFLAGPDFTLNVNVFAFRSSTAEYLGSYPLENYSNIRKWKEIGGHLYTALAAAGDGVSNGNYGHVLKWVGTPEEPFKGPDGSAPFVVVGMLPGQGAELSEYGADRIAVSTWPGGFDEVASGGNLVVGDLKHAGIYLSVPVSAEGLDPALAETNFKEVFTFADYDPDRARSFTSGGGALAYFDGWLVWGSMHVPETSSLAIYLSYSPYGLKYQYSSCRELIDAGSDNCPRTDPSNPDYDRTECRTEKYNQASPELQAEYLSCIEEVTETNVAFNQDAISIFRGRNLEAASEGEREIDVLYGYDTFKAYQFDTFFGIPQVGAGSWVDVPNGIGSPVFGGPGFGNPNNNYTWEMRIANNRLFVGTMDKRTFDDATHPEAGFDIYSFSSAQRAAVKEDGGGMGNPFNYGVRTMLPGTNNRLYLGTANPFNLAPERAGGWELIEVEVE